MVDIYIYIYMHSCCILLLFYSRAVESGGLFIVCPLILTTLPPVYDSQLILCSYRCLYVYLVVGRLSLMAAFAQQCTSYMWNVQMIESTVWPDVCAWASVCINVIFQQIGDVSEISSHGSSYHFKHSQSFHFVMFYELLDVDSFCYAFQLGCMVKLQNICIILRHGDVSSEVTGFHNAPNVTLRWSKLLRWRHLVIETLYSSKNC